MLDTNDEMYVHEQYKFGSKEKELAEFKDHVRRVIEASKPSRRSTRLDLVKFS